MDNSTYQPGDVANGHRLTEDGHWVPVTPEPPQDRRGLNKKILIGGGVIASLLVGLTVLGAIVGPDTRPAAATHPTSEAKPKSEPAPKETPAPDRDGDGTPDSIDTYPDDPTNTAPDRDNDGKPDSTDEYPDDPTNTPPFNPAQYGAIGDRDWELIAKNPDGAISKKVIVFAHVTQFDAATGTEGFRADVSATQQADWYDYDTNTVFTGDASMLAPVVQDDILKIYATVLGAYSYDTQIGGSTTVPSLQVNSVEVIGRAS